MILTQNCKKIFTLAPKIAKVDDDVPHLNLVMQLLCYYQTSRYVEMQKVSITSGGKWGQEMSTKYNGIGNPDRC